jgi:hypothetical protein
METEKLNALLKHPRCALFSAAVTGKIAIPKPPPNLPP